MRYLFAVLAFVAWGVNSLTLRFLQERGVTGPIPGFLGCLTGAVCVLVFIGENGRMKAANLYFSHPWRMFVQVLAFSFTSLTYQLAIQKTTIANAALTHAMQPMFTCLLFAPLLYKKRPSNVEVIAIALGMAGMYALLANELTWDGRMEGVIYGILSAVCYSVSLLNIASFPKDIDRKILLAAILAAGVPALLPFSLYVGFPSMSASTAAMAVAFGIVGHVIANACYFAALRLISVGTIATLSYLEPIVAIGAAALLLGEPLTASAILGGCLVLAASGLITWHEMRSTMPRPS